MTTVDLSSPESSRVSNHRSTPESVLQVTQAAFGHGCEYLERHRREVAAFYDGMLCEGWTAEDIERLKAAAASFRSVFWGGRIDG